MENDKLFINKRYLPDLKGTYPLYMNRNGVFKRIQSNLFASRIAGPDNIWYDLSDLPQEYQERFADISISPTEVTKSFNGKIESFYDNEQVLIYVKDNTELLPVVGNLLPNDGVPAFTVVNNGDKLNIKPIIICWDCHWSELFSGTTEYGMNVFCLASDLSPEQRIIFANDIIELSEVPDYLEQNKSSKL